MDLFFELLRLSLGNSKELSIIPSTNEWNALLIEAESQAVIGVLFSGLERLSDYQRPPKELLLRWIGLVQRIESVGQLHRERAKDLTSLFYLEGFDCCILKGVSISSLYPNPLRRQSGDIDLLTSGRRKEVMKWLQSKYVFNEIRWHHVDAKIFKDVQTEIHFYACWLFNPYHNKRLQEWMSENGLIFSIETEYGYKVPSVRFNAIHSLVHSFHHLIESGIGFRHVVDYYYVLKSIKEEIKSDLFDAIKSIGLNKYLGAMMYVLTVSCGASPEMLLCAPDEREGVFLLKEILSSGNFGNKRDCRTIHNNSFRRFWVMIKHYPNEVLWMYPWKIWHWLWRRRWLDSRKR